MSTARTAVCTIVARNYVPFARTLMGSLRDVHPDWERHVLLADEAGDVSASHAGEFRVVELGELDLPQPRRFLFRYSILELNTAVKPWLLEHLFRDRGYERVVYLDPDIYVYAPLVEVERALDSGSLACLTPHLTGPLADGRKPSELDILRAGAYNLGFIALARHPALDHFLAWWQSKTEFDCVVDFAGGRFVDQKWIDLVPGMYPDVSILRHEGYNVAYWNLAHRHVKEEDGRILVNGRPLVFFHFSGLDPARPAGFSKHQDRYALRDLGETRRLVLEYRDRVLSNGYEEWRRRSYAFARFADGEPIADEVRSLYRKDPEVQEAGGDDPFQLGADWFNQPARSAPVSGPLVTRLMRHVWESRPDLQRSFPDLEGRDRRDFVFWFVSKVAAEHALPEAYVAPARRSLAGSRDSSLREVLAGWFLRALGPARPVARRLPPRVKLLVRRWLRVRPPPALETIRPRPVLGFGMDHAGFFPMDAYDASVGSAWMGPKALVHLVESPAGTLRITGEHSADHCEAAHGSPRLRLRVGLDGVPLAEFQIGRSGRFEVECELARAVSDESILTLEADRSFVPARIGLGEDARELSLRIARVELCGRSVLDFARGGGAYVPRRKASTRMLGINVVGYLQSELGIGESARLCAAAADAAGIPLSLVDFRLGCSSRSLDTRWAERLSRENPHPVNLIHVNADQLPVALSDLGQAFFDHHYNIGFWHWELPEFPEEWLGSFAPLQEVWAPSRFVMDAISAKSPVPVVRMPHAVAFEVPSRATRERFGLPAGEFLFLTMYDMHSVQERKNPEAVIESFRRAFPDGRGVGLVVKLMNAESEPRDFERLRERLRGMPGVHLVAETLSREDVYALEWLCDAFVSLHRSEGFGLGLAESMYLGKPAIGTGWSGNMDFMDETNSCPIRYSLVRLERDFGPYRAGQLWADPDLDHAAWCMRRLVEDEALRRRIGSSGRETVRTQLSPTAVGQRYRERLRILALLV